MGRNTQGKQVNKGKPNQSQGSYPMWIVLVIVGVALMAVAFFALRKNDQPAQTVQPTQPDKSVQEGSAAQTGKGARLEVDRQSIDFGDVQVDNLVTAQFVLTNTGDQPLRFTKEPYITVVEGC